MSYTTNNTGGEYKHKLSVSEMPSHNHLTYGALDGSSRTSSNTGNVWYQIENAGWTSDKYRTNSVGGNSSHNNVQPYIVVYFWRRTA